MGTMVSFDIRDDVHPDVSGEAIDNAVIWLHEVDATWSTYKPGSPGSMLGRGELHVDDLPEQMHEVLDLCDLISADTDGAFDIHTPAPNGTQLEPSGLVKGWSIERAAAILNSYGLANFCLNAGGDIATRGTPSPGTPWKVGIRHPDVSDRIAVTVEAHDGLAIATSAAYERAGHIIDPRTGDPAASGLCSVTIVGPDLTYADAYATALYVMGLNGAVWLAETHPEYGAYVITDARDAFSTAAFDLHRASETDTTSAR